MWDEDAMLGLERGFLSRGAGRQCSRSVQRAEGSALGRGGGELASVDRARDTRPGPSACLCSTCGHHGRIPNPTKDFSLPFKLS